MKKLVSIMPAIFLIMAAFLIGFIAPVVAASHGDIGKIYIQVQNIPSQISRAIMDSSDSDGSNLPVLESYYVVLGSLRDNYYGQKIDDRQLTYNAIRGMLKALNDPYTRFLDPDAYKQMREENEGNFVGIGAQLDVNKKQQVYIKEPLADSPALEAGVKSGDIIVKVDDKPVTGLDIEQVVKRIRGAEGSKVKLGVLRGDVKKPVDIAITRRMVEFQMVKYKMLDTQNGIGYIRLYQFNEHSDRQFETAISALEKQNLRGLVFDLRQNPGGLLQVAVEIGSRFVEDGPIVIIQERTGRKDSLNVDPSRHNHKRYPLVVLVDKQSASASEIVSGAIQDNSAGTLVGTRTFGKARVQTVNPLLDGSAIAITTAKYLTPKGRDINKVGVQPDVKVENPEMAEIGDMKQDTQLIKGIQLVKEKMGISDKSNVAEGVSAKR